MSDHVSPDVVSLQIDTIILILSDSSAIKQFRQCNKKYKPQNLLTNMKSLKEYVKNGGIPDDIYSVIEEYLSTISFSSFNSGNLFILKRLEDIVQAIPVSEENIGKLEENIQKFNELKEIVLSIDTNNVDQKIIPASEAMRSWTDSYKAAWATLGQPDGHWPTSSKTFAQKLENSITQMAFIADFMNKLDILTNSLKRCKFDHQQLTVLFKKLPSNPIVKWESDAEFVRKGLEEPIAFIPKNKKLILPHLRVYEEIYRYENENEQLRKDAQQLRFDPDEVEAIKQENQRLRKRYIELQKQIDEM